MGELVWWPFDTKSVDPKDVLVGHDAVAKEYERVQALEAPGTDEFKLVTKSGLNGYFIV